MTEPMDYKAELEETNRALREVTLMIEQSPVSYTHLTLPTNREV